MRWILVLFGLVGCANSPTIGARVAGTRCPAASDQISMFGEFRRPGALEPSPDLTVERALERAGGLTDDYEVALVRCGRTFHLSHHPWAEVRGIRLRAGDRLLAPDPDSIY